MFSTSSLDKGFLESFTRVSTTDTHIRVISADEDPRRPFQNTDHTPGLPPYPHNNNYPPLGTNPPKWTPPKFFDLPSEIQEMIWEAYMYADGTLDDYSRVHIRYCVRIGCDPSHPHFMHSLVDVSKRTRNAIIAVQMRNSRFMISSIRDNTFFRRFIASVQDGPKHVRELHFDNFDFFPDHDPTTGARIPRNSDLDLAVDCTGLRTMRITMGRRFLGTTDTNGVYTEKTVQELVDKYRFDRLLDCGKLRKVILDGKHGPFGSVKVLDDLANWIKAGFAKKNHGIECEVRWRW